MSDQNRHPAGSGQARALWPWPAGPRSLAWLAPAMLPSAFLAILLAQAAGAAQAPAQDAVPVPAAGAGLRPAGAVPSSPGTAASRVALAPRLTKEQVERLERVVQHQGSDIAVPPPVATVLHFTPRQIAPTVRQATFLDDNKSKHGFAMFNDGSGYFLFRRSAQDGLSVFHVDHDFHLLQAAHNFQTDRFIEMTPTRAQDELNAEVVAWSHVLSPRGVNLPLPVPAGARAASPLKPKGQAQPAGTPQLPAVSAPQVPAAAKPPPPALAAPQDSTPPGPQAPAPPTAPK